jgi:hypothetical protein
MAVIGYKSFKFFLDKSFDCLLLKHKGLFFIKNRRGVFVLRLPSIYFLQQQEEFSFSLRFLQKSSFRSFFQCFSAKLKIYFYYFKIKVRGLGYRIKKLTNNLFRFFLGTTNYFFFHVPEDILVRARRRRMLLVSYNKEKLNLVFSHLLLLKQLIPYKLRGVFYPKQVILLKPGKKSF